MSTAICERFRRFGLLVVRMEMFKKRSSNKNINIDSEILIQKSLCNYLW